MGFMLSLEDLVRNIVREELAKFAPTAPPAANDNLPEYGTDHDVARLLDVSVDALQKWRRQKKGPPYVKVGRCVRYRLADVHAWLDGDVNRDHAARAPRIALGQIGAPHEARLDRQPHAANPKGKARE